jgi:cell division protein FtsL
VRRTLWVLLLAITVLAVMAIGVFPTRQYLAQRSATAERQTTLEQLRAENANLQSRVDALSTDAEIERIARSEYNLVRPGEESYAILPPPATGPRVPAIWPFTDRSSGSPEPDTSGSGAVRRARFSAGPTERVPQETA